MCISVSDEHETEKEEKKSTQEAENKLMQKISQIHSWKNVWIKKKKLMTKKNSRHF